MAEGMAEGEDDGQTEGGPVDGLLVEGCEGRMDGETVGPMDEGGGEGTAVGG